MEIGGDHRGLFFSQCYSSTRREYSMQQSDITHTFTNRIKPTSVQENFGTGCKAKLQKRERNMSHHTKAVYCIQPHVNLSCSLSTSSNPLVYRKKKKKKKTLVCIPQTEAYTNARRTHQLYGKTMGRSLIGTK